MLGRAAGTTHATASTAAAAAAAAVRASPVSTLAAVRVLAIGDSLTEGYHSGGQHFHPYSLRLIQLAHAAGLPNLVVHQRGISGELVIPTMVARLSHTLATAAESSEPFSHVLILGGTNDVGWGRGASEILNALLRMYQEAHRHGAAVVAMTLPGYHDPVIAAGPQGAVVHQLNHKLMQHLATHHKAQKPSEGVTRLVDLYAGLNPAGRLGPQQAAQYWDDQLHLTPAGYDRLSELVWEGALRDLLLPLPTHENSRQQQLIG